MSHYIPNGSAELRSSESLIPCSGKRGVSSFLLTEKIHLFEQATFDADVDTRFFRIRNEIRHREMIERVQTRFLVILCDMTNDWLPLDLHLARV